MKRTATLAAAAYVLAILAASLGPHCDWMFASSAPMPALSVTASGHEGHSGHHGSAPKQPAQDCAAMAMAKSVGPLPGAVSLAGPDILGLPAILSGAPVLVQTVRADLPQPRGPPRGGGGFAAIFAANHRLLI